MTYNKAGYPMYPVNRGIYLIIYTGPGQEDNPKNPGWLWLPKGCCKFGKSLELDSVDKRYSTHLNGNCKTIIAGKFKDQDDIDVIEKKLHYAFKCRRLKNRNGRPSEWMEPITQKELMEKFTEVIQEHFLLLHK